MRMGDHEHPQVREVFPDAIDAINAMCVMPGTPPEAALRDAAAVYRQVAAMGVRTFGAFAKGKPVGRLEIMPIAAAPAPLVGEDLWVIRCLWVLDEAAGRGVARALTQRALEVAAGSKGVAVLTYVGWMPVGFFLHFGFEVVDRRGAATVLLKRLTPDAAVSLAPAAAGRPDSGLPPRPSPGSLEVAAVVTGRCPWILQLCRHRLAAARALSPKVQAVERTILTRADALAIGEENIYIGGVALEDLVAPEDAFIRQLRERLGSLP